MFINTNPNIHKSPGAHVLPGTQDGTWKLKIPSSVEENYNLAQLDDYTSFSRDDFPWNPPAILSLRARASDANIPGTWGFGFWNDPFSLSLGLGGGTRRFPALPNAAWFFFASPQNYLSFRDDLPANGLIAQTFRSLKLPTFLMALGVVGFPILLWPWMARKSRAALRHLITEDSFHFNIDLTQWHSYTLEWSLDQVLFKVDDQTFETRITPNTPLGFVLWIDNQFAAFPPDGVLSYGTIVNPQPAWLEIEVLRLKTH
jgi:hypothetical protein